VQRNSDDLWITFSRKKVKENEVLESSYDCRLEVQKLVFTSQVYNSLELN
jgi:hypothetical protein